VLTTLTIVHVTEGRGRFRSEPSGVQDMPRNSVLFVFPNIHHAYLPDINTGWDDQWVEIDASHALPLLRKWGISEEYPLKKFDSTSKLSRLFQELFEISYIEDFSMEPELATCAYRILAHVIQLWNSSQANTERQRSVERMRQCLLNNLSNFKSVAELSEMAGMSPSRMRVIFKEATGMTPKQFQLEARISRAERLLTDSLLPIGIIAEQTGFDSVYHFSRQFKRMRQIAPQNFRNTRRSSRDQT